MPNLDSFIFIFNEKQEKMCNKIKWLKASQKLRNSWNRSEELQHNGYHVPLYWFVHLLISYLPVMSYSTYEILYRDLKKKWLTYPTYPISVQPVTPIQQSIVFGLKTTLTLFENEHDGIVRLARGGREGAMVGAMVGHSNIKKLLMLLFLTLWKGTQGSELLPILA